MILGKQIPASLVAWLAVKARITELPAGISWKQIYATGWLAGIGFTISLFISGLAFNEEANLEAAKIGILVASLTAGLIGFFVLRFSLGAKNGDEYVFSLHQAGASGYLLKTAPVSELIKAIRRVKAGESPLDPAIAQKVIFSLYGESEKQSKSDEKPLQGLTPREMEVLQRLVAGSNNRDIAQTLYISERTVQSHLTNIFAKLNVSSRREVVLSAIRLASPFSCLGNRCFRPALFPSHSRTDPVG